MLVNELLIDTLSRRVESPIILFNLYPNLNVKSYDAVKIYLNKFESYAIAKAL